MAVKLNNPADYKKNIKPYHPKPNYVKNCIRAFWTGGLICAFGQLIATFYVTYFNFTETTAGNPTVATLILIASLLTGFGVYDKIGQFAGAGSLVPVTGFANSITSAALEHKSEGIVLGVATNLFKLAGAVIVFGVVAAYIVGIIRLIFKTLIS
jgi:stage V sporulation protein AC